MSDSQHEFGPPGGTLAIIVATRDAMSSVDYSSSLHGGPSDVHPTAIVGRDVILDAGVNVGAYCIINGKVKIGSGTTILPHTIIEGSTLIGSSCRIGPHAVVGAAPQHTGYDGRETY